MSGWGTVHSLPSDMEVPCIRDCRGCLLRRVRHRIDRMGEQNRGLLLNDRLVGRTWSRPGNPPTLRCFTVMPTAADAMPAAGSRRRFPGVAVHAHWAPNWRYDKPGHARPARIVPRSGRRMPSLRQGAGWRVGRASEVGMIKDPAQVTLVLRGPERGAIMGIRRGFLCRAHWSRTCRSSRGVTSAGSCVASPCSQLEVVAHLVNVQPRPARSSLIRLIRSASRCPKDRHPNGPLHTWHTWSTRSRSRAGFGDHGRT